MDENDIFVYVKSPWGTVERGKIVSPFPLGRAAIVELETFPRGLSERERRKNKMVVVDMYSVVGNWK